MSPRAGKGKQRWRPPTPLVYLLLFARLSGSPFLASAQYINKRPEPREWGSQIDSKRDVCITSRRQSCGIRADAQQSSTSRSIWVESYDDFCLFGPPDPFNYIWSSGLNVVSWCSKVSLCLASWGRSRVAGGTRYTPDTRWDHPRRHVRAHRGLGAGLGLRRLYKDQHCPG